jgi:pimeloyl-ACP methyl ester carboxylesterase
MHDNRQIVVMIHGINTGANWHQQVGNVLEPFFRCEPIRYREYFGLGATKIFFWPWALVLSGAIGCVGVHRCHDAWCIWMFLGIVLVGALYEFRGWSVTRSLPWIVLLLSILICRSFGVTPEMALGFTVLAVFAYSLLIDYSWAGLTLGLAFVLAVGIIGAGLFYLMEAPPKRALALWVGLVLLVSFQEWRECDLGADVVGYWRAAMAVIPIFAIIIWYGIEHGPGWVGFGVALLLMVLGRSEPRLRLRRAEETIIRQLDDISRRLGRPPSLIAHSLGTYLAGNLFMTYPFVWDRVIFVGGVISEVYDWNVLHLGGPHPRVRNVRNEHGGWDLVVWSIRFSGRWGREHGLGTAGRYGFTPSVEHPVHSVPDVRAACPHCIPNSAPVLIHNYRYDRYRHSSYFLRRHARELWLPFLWHLVPAVYADFIETCECGAGYLQQRNTLGFREVERIFETLRWAWSPASGRNWTLAQYVEEALRDQIRYLALLQPQTGHATLDRVQRLVPALLCSTIDLALHEQEKSPADQDVTIVSWLDPLNAISHAAREALLRVLE